MGKKLALIIAAAAMAASLAVFLYGCGQAVSATVVDETAALSAELEEIKVTSETEPVTPAAAETEVPGFVEAEVPAILPYGDDIPEITAPPAEAEPIETEAPDEEEPKPVEAEEKENAPEGYFSDAAFIGNSLIRGLEIWGGISDADFYAVTSASVVSADYTKVYKDGNTLVGEMGLKQYGKIYALFGINEIAFEPDYFITLYSELLGLISEKEPDAQIYVMGLSPVTEKCSEKSDVFNMERIGDYNSAIYQMCAENGYFYIDLCSALAGEDGYLPEEKSTDGIHLTRDYYPTWGEYIKTHYID